MFDFVPFLERVPVFVLVFFRLAGLMLYAPLFGSARLPRRVRLLLVLVLSLGISSSVKAVPIPDSYWVLAVGIGGEMAYGLAIGIIVSLTFVAIQWAGEMIGQQMGFNLGEVFDPQFGSQASVIGDLYFMLTLVIFLIIRGHHAMLLGLRSTFDSVPLLSLTVDMPLFERLVGLMQAATVLAFRLASPVLVTMLVTDLALGLIGRAMPQFNVLQAGMSVRSLIGLIVVISGLLLTGVVINNALRGSFGVG